MLVAACLGTLAAWFITVDTAQTSAGDVENGDVVVFESVTAATLDPRPGQVVDVAGRGMSEVLAVGGDRVEWRRVLIINGSRHPLAQPLRRPENSVGKVSPLVRGAMRGVGASAKIPAALDIPRSPFDIPRHHVLVARNHDGETTTHLVPYADIRATGRLVIAAREAGERSVPRWLP